MNKVPLLAVVCFCLLLGACTKSYKVTLSDPVQHGGQVWQGYFVGDNGTPISMRLGIRNDRPGDSFTEGYLVSGTVVYRNNIAVRNDSIEMVSGLHSKLIGSYINDSTLVGNLVYTLGESKMVTPFVLSPSNAYRFDVAEKTIETNVNGTWILDYAQIDTVFSLRYDMRSLKELDLYRTNDTIIGKGPSTFQGVQSMDGVMTADGFKLASYHLSEPFLIEAVFLDDDHFEGTITSITDTYTFTGKRKNQRLEDVSYSESVFEGFVLTVIGLFEYFKIL